MISEQVRVLHFENVVFIAFRQKWVRPGQRREENVTRVSLS